MRDEYGGKGHGIFVGPNGGMKEMPMTNVVSDSKGEIYATKRGVIVDRDEARGAALAQELEGRAVFAKADVTDPAQVEAAIARAAELGPLRVAVSCAGVGWASRTLDKTGKPHVLELFRTVVG